MSKQAAPGPNDPYVAQAPPPQQQYAQPAPAATSQPYGQPQQQGAYPQQYPQGQGYPQPQQAPNGQPMVYVGQPTAALPPLQPMSPQIPTRTAGKFYWTGTDWKAPEEEQEWTTGLCDCTANTGNCCDTWCLPCCVIGHQWEASTGIRNSYSGAVCLGTLCCGWVTPILACVLRMRVLERYNIAEGAVMCPIAFFCTSCSLCQTHRELTARGVWPGGSCCENKALDIAVAPYWPATHPRFQVVME